jgi:pyruvate dehydrogenase E2 component (dihydrolipoyllysine-residue acetyltransferase)
VARDLTMPKLSDSMEEATIIHWLKGPGDAFARGEPLAEIETDKATVVYEAETDGVLERILVPEGESARMGEPIATLDGDAPGGPQAQARAAVEPSAVASEVPRRTPARSERARATPVARRRAVELGVSLFDVRGSGPGGRITVEDVERAGTSGTRRAAPNGKGDVEPVELTATQATIAKRMELATSIPTFTVTAEIDMSTVVELRRHPDGLGGPAPSVNDFLVRAAALTLRKFPAFNSSWTERGIERYSRVNVGIAVAVEGALLVPTLFDADAKPLAQIAAESRSLAERARSRSLTPDELTRSTFTVSNLGMCGVRSFTAIVDPPQAAILAVGGIERRPYEAEGEQVAFRDSMLATLSADHRVVYGADGAAFLAHLKTLLEQPLSLL